MTKTRYKIGEVAQKFAISIRILRYYDSIDLLPPKFKDENGYRYYNASDIVKLEQILLLQMLNFSLQEIKELFVSDNITDELMVQEEFISNKIKYLSQIKDNIKKIRQSDNENLNNITDNIKQLYSVVSDQFHEESDLKTNHEVADQHEELIRLFRKLLDDFLDECDIYNKILSFVPELNSAEFSSQFFTLLRLSKSNRFKRDEIDRIEKIIIKTRISLDSTIM